MGTRSQTQYIQYRKPQTENEIYQVEMVFSRYSWWVRLGTGSQKSYISVRNLLASWIPQSSSTAAPNQQPIDRLRQCKPSISMETNLSGLLATDDLSQGEVERLQLDYTKKR